MNTPIETAKKIVNLRQKKGWTQEQLAEGAGVSTRTIQRIEAGKVKPQLNTICQLARILEVTPEDLIETESDYFQEPSEKTSLIMLHLTPLVFFILPALGNIIGPVIYWLWKRDNPTIRKEGKRLINFQVTLTLFYSLFILAYLLNTFKVIHIDMISTSSMFTIFFSGVLITGLIFFSDILLNLYRMKQNKPALYPFTIPFFQARNT